MIQQRNIMISGYTVFYYGSILPSVCHVIIILELTLYDTTVQGSDTVLLYSLLHWCFN